MNNLIVGLGNIGDEYRNTRHNMGFLIVDALAAAAGVNFEDKRYGFLAEMHVKNQTLWLLKPSTYMNLSGMAVRYWMNKKNIELERLLVVNDDLALPLGTLRMKPSGSEGGHNGLRNITAQLGTNQYSRLRVGIGNDYPPGSQIDWVLGRFSSEEMDALKPQVEKACQMITTFCLAGVQTAMNQFNGK